MYNENMNLFIGLLQNSSSSSSSSSSLLPSLLSHSRRGHGHAHADASSPAGHASTGTPPPPHGTGTTERENRASNHPNVDENYLISYIMTLPQPQLPLSSSFSFPSSSSSLLSLDEICRRVNQYPFDGAQMEETMCAISHDVFVDGETIAEILHCGHKFKPALLFEWFARANTCPVCRHNLRTQDPPPALHHHPANVPAAAFAAAEHETSSSSDPVLVQIEIIDSSRTEVPVLIAQS